MTSFISFLVLGAAWTFGVLLPLCLDGCFLTTMDLLIRWSSGTAGVLLVAWFFGRKGR